MEFLKANWGFILLGLIVLAASIVLIITLILSVKHKEKDVREINKSANRTIIEENFSKDTVIENKKGKSHIAIIKKVATVEKGDVANIQGAESDEEREGLTEETAVKTTEDSAEQTAKTTAEKSTETMVEEVETTAEKAENKAEKVDNKKEDKKPVKAAKATKQKAKEKEAKDEKSSDNKTEESTEKVAEDNENKEAEKEPAEENKTTEKVEVISDEEVVVEEVEETKEGKKSNKYRVIYSKEQKCWIVRMDGGKRASRLCATKEEALKVAKDLAKKKDANLSVHKKNGKFQKQ